MPLSRRRSTRRSRTRCDVIPEPMASGCNRMRSVMPRAPGRGWDDDPAGDLLERVVARQVDLDRRDRNVAGPHGVEIRTGARVLLGASRADPPPLAAARVLLRDAGFGTMPVAQARDFESAHVFPGN